VENMTQSDVMSDKNQLGEVFQQARLAKKLSVEDVSNAIHLSEKQIAALEANNFNALPEAVITRGFIRNYARFLELDDAPLLQAYRNLVPNIEQKSIVVKANVNQVMSHKVQQPWLVYMLSSILVLLFLTAWFYYMDSVESGKDKAPEAQVAQVAENVDAETLIAQPIEGIAPESGVEDKSPIANLDGQLPAVPNETIESATPVDANQTKVAQAPVNQPPVVAKKLELQFSADSWVRVKDKTGQTILEKTATAGSTETIDADPPFNIIIGNALAAKVKYYGQEVDLAPSTSKNIIRLKLE
jgi:cytoskeleton protein RodZ